MNIQLGKTPWTPKSEKYPGSQIGYYYVMYILSVFIW